MRLASALLPWMLGTTLLGWLGCGGGSTSGASIPVSHPPSISNLSVTPGAVYLGGGGGTTTVSATFTFTDTGGDLASLTLTIKNGANVTIQTLAEQPITAPAGLTSGTLFGQVTVATSQADTYSFQITIKDNLGASSNALTGTFQVAPLPTTTLPGMANPRDRVTAATMGRLIQVLGGGDSLGNHFTTMESFDPATGLWATRSAMAVPHDPAVAGVIGGKILVAAGGLSRTTEAFDPATNTWSTVASMLTERQHAAGCELGGKLYVVGGNQGMDLNTVEAYDPALDVWTTCAPIPLARSWSGACSLGGKLYVIGGYASSSVSPWLNRVDIYDPATNTWSVGPPIPIALGIYQHAVVALDGKVVVFGGANAARGLDTVYRFDPASGLWTQGASLPRLMSQFGAGTAGGKAYLFDRLGTICYDPAKDLGPLN